MPDTLVYLYAIGDAALASLVIGGLVGVGGAPVRVIVSGRLAAVVSSVPRQQFGEESLRRNLENLPWLTATARAHHRVVDAIGRDHPIAPLRLATVYVDDDSIRALVDAEEEAFTAALERIRGCHEWGVKAFAAARTDLEPSDDDPALGPGAAYLFRRRAARERASRARRQTREAAESLHQVLAAAASASRRYPPQDPALSGHREDMVLNAAYLVEVGGSRAFTSVVDAWRSPLIEVTLTGPWPPYSFAALEQP
jgi:hypothetical protein